MASAEKNIEVVETVKGVTLELSLEEAQILAALLGKCKRNDTTSPIYKALRNAGVDRGDWKVEAANNYELLPTIVARKRPSGW